MKTSSKSAEAKLVAEDTKRLHDLGYAQELFRAMGGFSNFAISFTVISVLSGCLTLFYLIPSNGGFPVATIGWPIVTLFVLIVTWLGGAKKWFKGPKIQGSAAQLTAIENEFEPGRKS
jgi:O-antigen/teichoic acid export membrane protein